MAKPEPNEKEKSAGNLNDAALEEITGGNAGGMTEPAASGDSLGTYFAQFLEGLDQLTPDQRQSRIESYTEEIKKLSELTQKALRNM